MANASEGGQSQLGTTSGREFLLDNEDLNTKFLAFCVKSK